MHRKNELEKLPEMYHNIWKELRTNIYYRVFIKYCAFFQKFSKACCLSLASPRLLLVVQKITSQ